jgi:hypothetical protein
MENAQDVYSRTVSHLPEPERLRLALQVQPKCATLRRCLNREGSV